MEIYPVFSISTKTFLQPYQTPLATLSLLD